MRVAGALMTTFTKSMYLGHFPIVPIWDSWTDGAWRAYWFAFWSAVAGHYNAEANETLWGPEQTNLTRAVALRLFQKLFIEKAIDRVDDVLRTLPTLASVLGDDVAEIKILEQHETVSIAATSELFVEDFSEWFLKEGVPVRVFTTPWIKSLDDSDGQANLYGEFDDAFNAIQEGRQYRAQNKYVFAVG